MRKYLTTFGLQFYSVRCGGRWFELRAVWGPTRQILGVRPLTLRHLLIFASDRLSPFNCTIFIPLLKAKASTYGICMQAITLLCNHVTTITECPFHIWAHRWNTKHIKCHSCETRPAILILFPILDWISNLFIAIQFDSLPLNSSSSSSVETSSSDGRFRSMNSCSREGSSNSFSWVSSPATLGKGASLYSDIQSCSTAVIVTVACGVATVVTSWGSELQGGRVRAQRSSRNR